MPARSGRRHFWRNEMSTNYPRALYKGDQKNNEYVIADGEDHEAKLREQGFVHFLELPEPDPVPEDSEIEIIGKVVSSEELEQVQKKLLEALKTNKELEEQLATAKGEYISRINALKKENDTYKYSAMDAGELKAILDEKGVKYSSRDGKDVLVNHVLEILYPVEVEDEQEE